MPRHAVATQVEASPGNLPQLFTPDAIGPITLKNRVIMAPMATRMADAEGFVTDDSIAYYAARAAAGDVALMTVAMAAPVSIGTTSSASATIAFSRAAARCRLPPRPSRMWKPMRAA